MEGVYRELVAWFVQVQKHHQPYSCFLSFRDLNSISLIALDIEPVFDVLREIPGSGMTFFCHNPVTLFFTPIRSVSR